MDLLKNFWAKKEEKIRTYDDFWSWFKNNEKSFFLSVKKQSDINKNFFDKLSPKLEQIRDGFFFLIGMLDDETAELIFTADGNIKNIVFVEELVNAAPKINGWIFTALKPPQDIKYEIRMDNYVFNKDNLFFYSNDHLSYPDEIDITIIYRDFKEDDRSKIMNGIYIFIDNFLGELNSVTTIDSLTIIAENESQKALIPIEKLKDFLIWRQKEFIEKYEGVLWDTENSNYSALEAELDSGNMLIATINTDILNWDKKASHPWMLNVEIKYGGTENNGMPDDDTYKLMNDIEEDILKELKDYEGYLNVGRQTADGIREIYFACKEFKKPSKVLHSMMTKYSGIEMSYDIFKDKYWKSLNRFNSN